MTAPTNASADPTAAAPRRRRFRALLRDHRFASAVVTLLAFALLFRLAWGWYARRELAAALDDVRRRGQPTAPGDSAEEIVPDSENAWPFYAKAILALKPNVFSPRSSALNFPDYPPYGAPWDAAAAASETANAGIFPAARAARQRPRSQFPRPRDYDPAVGSPEWNQARHLANTLADGALYAHQHGDDAEAVERLLDLLHLARSLRQDPHLVGQLVAVGVDALSDYTVQLVAPTLRLDASAGGTPASPAQARQLIASLLDETDHRARLARALARERAVMLDMLNSTADGTWAIRPLADRTALRWVHAFDALVDAANSPRAHTARQVARALEKQNPMTAYAPPAARPIGNTTDIRYSRWFEIGGPENLARSIEQFHRASAERRATAFIVAARLYRQDHGRWPDQAADLVPNYLDPLPVDPFREDGGPLGYVLKKGALPDGGDRPLVYFESGDPGADVIDVEPMYGWQTDRWTRKPGTPRREVRQYRDVSYWLPKARRFDMAHSAPANPSTQAVNADPDEPDAPGDEGKDDDTAQRPPEQ
jgi:hypothetical protein